VSGPVRVAAIQIDSQEDERRNLARARELALRARDLGARLIAFPENLLYEGDDGGRRHPLPEWEPRLAALAAECEAFLVAGSLREPEDGGQRAWNTCLVFDPRGERLARYRKIHLFDVDVPGGPTERESQCIRPGEEPVVVDLPGLFPLGLAICYDLRFPELFRALVERGARVVALPTSFALMTGKDHWEVLVRARAIEDQLFLVAPGQFGRKPHGRVKFGGTMIVDPWGTVLARAGEVPEQVVVAELDLARQEQVRRALPCLEHRRLRA
jgi:predicted amidohydrolase